MPDRPTEKITPRLGIDLLVDAQQRLMRAKNVDATNSDLSLEIQAYLDVASPAWRLRPCKESL